MRTEVGPRGHYMTIETHWDEERLSHAARAMGEFGPTALWATRLPLFKTLSHTEVKPAQ